MPSVEVPHIQESPHQQQAQLLTDVLKLSGKLNPQEQKKYDLSSASNNGSETQSHQILRSPSEGPSSVTELVVAETTDVKAIAVPILEGVFAQIPNGQPIPEDIQQIFNRSEKILGVGFAEIDLGGKTRRIVFDRGDSNYDLSLIKINLPWYREKIEQLGENEVLHIELSPHVKASDLIVYSGDRGIRVDGGNLSKVTEISSMQAFRTVQEIVRAVDHEDTTFDKQLLKGTIEPQAAQFQAEYNPHQVLSEAREAELDTWVESREGIETVGKLTDAVMELLEMTANKGMAGHDQRHLIKDLANNLRFALEESDDGEPITPHRMLAMVGSALHDFGRLGEEKLNGISGSGFEGDQHPKISWYFAKMLLDNPAFANMPDDLKKQIEYAILVHQEPNNHPSKFAKLVQRGDRMDLVGDWFYRIYGSDVGLHDVDMRYFQKFPHREGENEQLLEMHDKAIALGLPAIPGRAGDLSVFQHVMFYARNLHKNIGGKSAQAEEVYRRAVAVAYVLRGTIEAEQAQLFAAERARDKGEDEYARWQEDAKFFEVRQKDLIEQQLIQKPLYLPHRDDPKGPIVAIDPEVWKLAQDLAANSKLTREIQALSQNKTLFDLVYDAVHIPSVAISEGELQQLHAKILAMPPDEQERMKQSVAFGILMQREQDADDEEVVQRIKRENLSQATAAQKILYASADFVDRKHLVGAIAA